jgi:hypothetical protein
MEVHEMGVLLLLLACCFPATVLPPFPEERQERALSTAEEILREFEELLEPPGPLAEFINLGLAPKEFAERLRTQAATGIEKK